MDFSWSPEQQDLYESVVRFAETSLRDDVVARDHAGEFPAELWHRCAEFGVLGWPVPESAGGRGHDVTTVVYLMEAALTKVYLSEAFTQSSLEAISVFGGSGYKTATAIERNLRDAIGGTIYGGTVDIQRNIVRGLLGL